MASPGRRLQQERKELGPRSPYNHRCGSSKLNDEPQFGVRGPSLETAVHYMGWS